MEPPVEKLSAAVAVLVFVLIGIMIYLFLIPPATVSNLVGNFTNLTPNTTSVAIPTISYYYPITSYLGGNAQPANFTYPFRGFAVSYSAANSSITEKPFTLTSSIFGASSNNIKFNGDSSDSYYLVLNVSSVSGTPYLKLEINGKYFYSSIASTGLLKISVPDVISGKDVLTLSNYLNGFALSQSIGFSNVSLVQTSYVNTQFSTSITVSSILGLGNYVLQFTPIGYGNMSVSANGVVISTISSGSDVPQSVSIPESVVNKAVGAVASTSSETFPLDFNLVFSVSKGGKYIITDNDILYSIPLIPIKSVSIPYTIKDTSSQYIFSLYISSIVKSGNVTFSLYPSGESFSIPAGSLSVGENIVVEPASYLAGDEINGEYTGVITVSSSGLIAPTSLTITPSLS